MREAASRGFFLGSNAPFGYKRVKVNDGGKERPTLVVDPATAPIVKEICKELNHYPDFRQWFSLKLFTMTYHGPTGSVTIVRE